MKSLNFLSILGILCLTLSGCGAVVVEGLPLCVKGVICHKKEDKPKPKPKKTVESFSCLLEPATQNTISTNPDEDIKLYRTTVNRVLSELRKAKDYDPDKFWTTLSPETRDLLNYELNLIIVNTNRGMNEEALYRSTAFFFSRVRAGFSDDLVYRVKYRTNMLFSFKIRAANTRGTHRFSNDCGKIESKDVVYFTIPSEVKRYSTIKQVYECRSESLNMILMEMKDSLYLSAQKVSDGRVLFNLPSAGLEKKERNRRLELKFTSSDIKFNLNVSRKRDEDVRDWEGKETRLIFLSPKIDIDEKGACVGLFQSIEDRP